MQVHEIFFFLIKWISFGLENASATYQKLQDQFIGDVHFVWYFSICFYTFEWTHYFFYLTYICKDLYVFH